MVKRVEDQQIAKTTHRPSCNLVEGKVLFESEVGLFDHI